MTSRTSSAERQRIVEDFCERHGRDFDPKAFLEEVETTGAAHPAFNWFLWDNGRAAYEYRLWQSRTFAHGLRISFTVEEIRRGSVTIRTVEAPLLLSPVAGRATGGGYVLVDLDDPADMVELCRQAQLDLARWLRRYEAALVFAGGSADLVEGQARLLEAAARGPKEKAA